MKLIKKQPLTSNLLENYLKKIKINNSPYKQKAYELANNRCIETLLNCFYRETLSSGQYIRILNKEEVEKRYPKIPLALINEHLLFMNLNLITIQAEILIAVKQGSKIGFCHYLSAPYIKKPDGIWHPISGEDLSFFLLEELSNSHRLPFNHDLLEQIKNSVRVMTTSLAFHLQADKKQKKELSFLDSEQLLLFGHSFHPSPKSREGMTLTDVQNFSPELRANFSLYYFLVKKEFLIQESVLDISAAEIIEQNAPSHLAKNHEYALICAHPWQVRYLKQLPIVQKNLAQGNLCDLGPQGDKYYPTSSIRTVYHPNNPFFYKFSLNVRITNCVRKNSVCELKTAVCLTNILLHINEISKNKFPDFHLMLEPAFLSIALPGTRKEEIQQVAEGFGMIFRQNFTPHHLATTPILSGTLFSSSLAGDSYIYQTILQLADCCKIDYDSAALKWFDAYIEKILYPLLDYHFNLGITFEPHLQNVLIGMKDCMPTCIFVRDLEGTKLNMLNSYLHYLSGLDEKAIQSLHYSEQLAWNRMSYCLLVNNIGEAIFHISNGDALLENSLWDNVKHHLCCFLEKYGNEHSRKRIMGLLSTDPLPIKANFMTRFLKKPDKGAIYYYLTDHPLKGPIYEKRQ